MLLFPEEHVTIKMDIIRYCLSPNLANCKQTLFITKPCKL